jgi:hypothetical protein
MRRLGRVLSQSDINYLRFLIFLGQDDRGVPLVSIPQRLEEFLVKRIRWLEPVTALRGIQREVQLAARILFNGYNVSRRGNLYV